MALFQKKCLSYAYYMLTFVDGNLLLYLGSSDYLEYPFFDFFYLDVLYIHKHHIFAPLNVEHIRIAVDGEFVKV